MTPTVEQLRFLNGLLSLLANDYVAKVDDCNLPQGVIVTFQLADYEDRLDCGLTIDPSDEDDGKWTVNAVVVSYGNRECPDDVEVVEIEGPCTWEQASASLVKNIMAKLLDDALANVDTNAYAQDCSDTDFGDFELPNDTE